MQIQTIVTMKHRSACALAFALLCVTTAAHATTYFVSSGAGSSDSNNGLSPSTPFHTIQQAANVVNPGDTVNIMAGTHIDSPWNPTHATAWIQRSGTTSQPITFQNYGGTAIVSTNGTRRFGFRISASNIRVAGLTFIGNRDFIPLNDAKAIQNVPVSSMTDAQYAYLNQDAIHIDQLGSDYPQHITVQNCELLNNSSSAITVWHADYITLQNNTIYDNCQRTNQATSAIDFLGLTASGGNTDTSTKMIVQNNRIFNNETLLLWQGQGIISDGSGIIVDESPSYNGRVRIQNNLCYNNGGAGIAVTNSRNTDIYHNTCYRNARSSALTDWSNIMVTNSNGVNVLNNIIWARSNRPVFKNTTSGFDYNVLYHEGASVSGVGSHDVLGDPLFITRPLTDWDGNANFSLQSSSPAIDRGTNVGLTTDYNWSSRPKGTASDIGAIEVR